VRNERFNNGAEVPGRQKAGDPLVFATRVAVDRSTELKGEAGLASPRWTDERMNRNVSLVIEPRLKLGEEIFAADQRQVPRFGDEKIELARRRARDGPATALPRPELLPSKR
jgi:hypothetical protein